MWLILLKAYWKPLAVTGLILAILGSTYFKGRYDCNIKQALKETKSIVSSINQVEHRKEELQKIEDEIKTTREKKPINDLRDSCLLSNDPFSVKCY